jgi:tetratricopeptide (TPR) repeat protein
MRRHGWIVLLVTLALLGLGSVAGAAAAPAVEMLLDGDASREESVISGLIKMGAIDQGAMRIGKIADSDTLFHLRTQHQYEPLWSNPVAQGYLRLEDFAERHIAAQRLRSQRDPRNLLERHYLISLLWGKGRFDEAVDLAQDALRNISSYKSDPESAAWIRDDLAHALISRGEFDAANDAIKPVALVPTRAKPYLVNFAINYSSMLHYEGRFDDAIRQTRVAEAFGRADTASPYGISIIRYVQLCALQHLGKTADAQRTYDAVVKMPGRSPYLILNALLCLDRTDEAASLLTAMLGDSRIRIRTFATLQDCVDNPKLPQLWVALRTKTLALRDRPEVRQAIDKIGVPMMLPHLCPY